MRRHYEGRLTLDQRYPVRETPLAPDVAPAKPVRFASDAARDAARKAGLEDTDLARQNPTGAGGFTVADIERIGGE